MSHVLIVEDENFLVRALKDNLVAEGFTVDIARNGEEGVEKIGKKRLEKLDWKLIQIF